jgi:hypothetical protein
MYNERDPGTYFKNGIKSLLDEVPQSITRAVAVMGQRGTPKMPWYLYHSTNDTMSPVELTDKLAETHCASGASIYYERSDAGYDHLTEAIIGFTGAFTWLKARQDGVAAKPGCATVNQTVESKTGFEHGEFGKGLWDCFTAWLGVPIRKG